MIQTHVETLAKPYEFSSYIFLAKIKDVFKCLIKLFKCVVTDVVSEFNFFLIGRLVFFMRWHSREETMQI